MHPPTRLNACLLVRGEDQHAPVRGSPPEIYVIVSMEQGTKARAPGGLRLLFRRRLFSSQPPLAPDVVALAFHLLLALAAGHRVSVVGQSVSLYTRRAEGRQAALGSAR